MKKQLLVFFLLIVSFTQSFSQIKINEVQSSNTKTIKDPQFQEYGDWVELYNPGTSSINIGGYYLTDDKDEPRKWQIPTGTSIAAKGYLIVWADGKNLNLHANYKLGVDGEKLLLYSNTMLFQDSVRYPVIETDFSFGRTVNGAGEWALLTAPTPGTSNVSTVVKGLAPKPNFNIQGGFYNSNQSITLTSPLAGAVIRYTTDGSEPTASSPIYSGTITAQKTTKTTQKYGNNRLNKTGIQKYQWPTTLSYPPGYYDGTREYGYVIKAKVFHPDYLPSNTAGQTYFINMRKPTLPVVSITTDFNNFFSADSGIYIQGTNGVSNGSVTANWYQDWERKGHIEFFDATGSRKFGVNAGISTMGAVSRSYDLKSLNIVMKNKYEQGSMQYQLFGADGLSEYKSFILRNSGNDWEMGNFARDAIIQSIVRGQVDLETQDYQPVVMNLNGEYWGLINMRERYDENLFAGYHSYADASDLDLLKINGDEKIYEPSEGDAERYNEMMAFVNANSMTVASNYEIMRTKYVDVDNMINYYIAQIYCQNTDWPANNARLWRPRVENGKFRFPLYDTDFGYGLWGGEAYSNNLSRTLSTTESHAWATLLFRKMMENADFKNEFIQRYAFMINTVYGTTRLNTIANDIENLIKTERDTYNDAEWTRGVNSGYNTDAMISWGTSRISQARSHINSQFG
ncbi:MAG TPA: CotH kinase family protein, partial [Bacteroidales bacterium]|nr:CotH kinase family protein [Bacteroidales bacterium]